MGLLSFVRVTISHTLGARGYYYYFFFIFFFLRAKRASNAAKPRQRGAIRQRTSGTKVNQSPPRATCAMGLMHNYVIQCMRVRLGGIAKQVPPFSVSVCSISTYWLQIYLFNSETVCNKRRIKFNPPPEEEYYSLISRST